MSLYGISIGFGALSAILWSERKSTQQNLNPKILYGAINRAIIFGLIGARAYHVIDYWWLYSRNPKLIPKIWLGGLGIWGGILLGGLSVILYLKRNKEPVREWLDIMVLGLPLAQAIGRWGNYFNKELYGPTTNLPWGIWIEGKKRHPLFLYESLLDLLLFIGLNWAWSRWREKLPKGSFAIMYLLGYWIIRLILHPLRLV